MAWFVTELGGVAVFKTHVDEDGKAPALSLCSVWVDASCNRTDNNGSGVFFIHSFL